MRSGLPWTFTIFVEIMSDKIILDHKKSYLIYFENLEKRASEWKSKGQQKVVKSEASKRFPSLRGRVHETIWKARKEWNRQAWSVSARFEPEHKNASEITKMRDFCWSPKGGVNYQRRCIRKREDPSAIFKSEMSVLWI